MSLYTNEQIFQLIPQRPPIVMIDTVLNATDTTITTSLTVTPDNIFIRNSHLEEAGLIEHIAQSAAALAGIDSMRQHQMPKIGFVGEVKDFECGKNVGRSIPRGENEGRGLQ